MTTRGRPPTTLPRHRPEQPARRLHVYGIGSQKTGTHSLAAMFARHFRSAHEPKAAMLVAMMGRLQRGDLSQAQLDDWLLARDRLLGLEVDVSSLNGELAPSLARLFDQVRFVLTLREPFSWLDSLVNQHLVRNPAQHWLQARLQAFGPFPECYPRQEAWLAERGLHSISAYVRYWSSRNLALIDALPAERLLVLHTRDLRARADDLAAFCGIGRDQLDLTRSHEFKSGGQVRLLANMDADHVRREVLREGRPLLQRCFPALLVQLQAEVG